MEFKNTCFAEITEAMEYSNDRRGEFASTRLDLKPEPTYYHYFIYIIHTYMDRINELSQTLIMDLRDSNTKIITILEFSQFLAGICTISFKPTNLR